MILPYSDLMAKISVHKIILGKDFHPLICLSANEMSLTRHMHITKSYYFCTTQNERSR